MRVRVRAYHGAYYLYVHSRRLDGTGEALKDGQFVLRISNMPESEGVPSKHVKYAYYRIGDGSTGSR